MRSTLFYIPYDWNGVPVMGLGWLLLAWVVLSAGIMGWLIRKQGWNKETASYLPFLGVIALVIAVLLPNMMELAPIPGQPDKFMPVGIPIRGFGVMMMVAMVVSVGLGMYRAWRMGIDPEVMISLAMWMIFPGIIGARLFFIVQNIIESDGDFLRGGDVRAMLISFVDVTKGGLVVYGAVLASVPVGVYYIIRRGLPLLATLDIIAPSMILGGALGRIGCFLNGCCYGGECTWPVAVTFPPRAAWYLNDSPPYERQHELGQLYGMTIGETDGGRAFVQRVKPGAAAERGGVKRGDILTHINGKEVQTIDDAKVALGLSGKSVELTTSTGDVRRIIRENWPGRSLPIHPTQLYSALDAGLLALLLWVLYPFRRKDGEIFALLITVHPISRYLLESIRTDEPGQFGTDLTISQWISLGILVAAAGFWYYVEKQPRGSALPRMANGE